MKLPIDGPDEMNLTPASLRDLNPNLHKSDKNLYENAP